MPAAPPSSLRHLCSPSPYQTSAYTQVTNNLQNVSIPHCGTASILFTDVLPVLVNARGSLGWYVLGGNEASDYRFNTSTLHTVFVYHY